MISGGAKAASPETFVLRAFAISVAIHLLCFGGWKLGQAQGWWQRDLTPKWIQALRSTLIKQIAKTLPAQPKPKETPLLFVDVDPALATPEAPKTPKFYGAANSQSATREKKVESDLPQINGTQTKVLKTTENLKSQAQPLQPVPPEPPKKVEPAPKPVPQEPKQAQPPGDLAFAKPVEKSQPEIKSESTPEQPRRRRPTVAEAREKAGLSGEKMQHTGGGHRLAMESSLDVARTATGSYDWKLVQAVQECWYRLLDARPATKSGKVVIEFRLHQTGRVTDAKIVENETDDIQAIMCQQAIERPAPYDPWPTQMRREISRDYRDVKFTFFYLN